MQKEKNKYISSFAIFAIIVFSTVGIIHLFTESSYAFADAVNSTLSQYLRIAFASIGNLVEFSLIELVIMILPAIIGLIIYKAVRVFRSGEGRVRFIINLVSILLLIYSGHLLALGVGHNTTPIDDKMGLTETEVDREVLVETLTALRDEVNALADQVTRDENGVFAHGYTYDDVSRIFSDSYSELADAFGLPFGYYTRAKGVNASWAMGYLGISGIYTYPTGEANVNTLYPDYVTLFTIAHEMAHQRGILRENEANFVAYLLTSTSDDPAFRYSGALNMYNYFANALYKTDKDAYYDIASELSPLARKDMQTASAVTKQYSDTIISDISEKINELYLQSSGSGGVVSYSRVVELVLAYRYSSDNN